MNHYLRFGHCIIKIQSDDNIVADYLAIEYDLLDLNSAMKYDCKINVKICTIRKIINKPLLIIRSFNRAFAVKFVDINDVEVIIPKSPFGGSLHKIINSNNENRITACLVDFFHNTFLGILQLCIAKYRDTLFHAGGIVLDGDTKGTLLFGGAQSGKSTIVDILSKDYKAKVISEDFCILSNNGEVFALPHQARVSYSRYREIRQDRFSIGEMLNILMCRLTKRKLQRRLPFKDIYSGRQLVMKSIVGRIYLLKRTGNTIRNERCDKDTFIRECIEILENEFRNFVGFSDTLKILSTNNAWPGTWQNMIDDTKSILFDVYDNVDCSILYVPIYETVGEAVERLYCYMMDGACND